MKAGIIGGTGKMGRFFTPVFERAGYEVMVTGQVDIPYKFRSGRTMRSCHRIGADT